MLEYLASNAVTAEHFWSFLPQCLGGNRLVIFVIFGFPVHLSPSICKPLALYQQANYISFYFLRLRQK